MKTIANAVILMLIATSFTVDKKNSEIKLKSFSWLIGSWKMETKRGAIYEKWDVANDSSFSGESYIIRTTRETVPLEKIQLVRRGNEYFYIPVARGQNNDQPVKFTITNFNESGFVAENPGHDFPKRITYKLVTKDSIHAYIDGGPAMPDKKSDFYYSRQNK